MKDRHIKTPLGLVCVTACAFSSIIAGTPSEAQAQDADAHRVYDACYVPRTGAVYIVTDTQEGCRSDRHVAFSFTYSDGHSLDAADGDPSDAVYVDDDGNVGIGTDSPGEALSVAGAIESTSGGFKFPDGSIQTSAAVTGKWQTHHVSSGIKHPTTWSDTGLWVADAWVDCPAGEFPLTGGYTVYIPLAMTSEEHEYFLSKHRLTVNGPAGNFDWRVIVVVPSNEPLDMSTWSAEAWTLCANVEYEQNGSGS